MSSILGTPEYAAVRAPVVYEGLGKDVSGLCSDCKRNRTLEVQHTPTDAWLCRPCFVKRWVDAPVP